MFEDIMDLDVERTKSLSDLLFYCKLENVEINKVRLYKQGYLVEFKGVPGNAILHNGSYGKTSYLWETMEMPWDNKDVSVHSAEVLAHLLGALSRNEDWNKVLRSDS